MLEQILDYIHNYFEKQGKHGRFVISNGALDVDFLQDGQYFRICGSVFNDGVHRHPTYSLTDEAFEGVVWALAVPPAVISLATDIEDWVEKYGDSMNSPYNSESFGGYSYSKSSGSGSQGNVDASVGWKDMFRSRLNRWRKI